MVNRERKMLSDMYDEIAGSGEELELQQIMDHVERLETTWGKAGKWTIRATGNYDGGGDLVLELYRYETQEECDKRVATEEEAERKKKDQQDKAAKMREETKMEKERKQQELLKDPDYIKLLELHKKFNIALINQ